MTDTQWLLDLLEEATPGPWSWLDKFVWGFEGPKIERLSEAKISASDARLIALAPDLARLCVEQHEALERIDQADNQALGGYGKKADDALTEMMSALEQGRAALARFEELKP